MLILYTKSEELVATRMIWTPKAFLTLGVTIGGERKFERDLNKADTNFFKRTYGVSPEVCSQTWELLTLRHLVTSKARPKHLLWALVLLNIYSSEIFLSRLLMTTEKTFRKWCWVLVRSICRLYPYVVSSIPITKWTLIMKKWFNSNSVPN